jgi:hypothetical protein
MREGRGEGAKYIFTPKSMIQSECLNNQWVPTMSPMQTSDIQNHEEMNDAAIIATPPMNGTTSRCRLAYNM